MKFLNSPNAALILAIVYFVFPLDLVPDIFGPLGRMDDLLVFGIAVWRILKDRRERTRAHNTEAPRQAPPKSSSTYDVFQIKPGASRAEIDARYKELAKDYHPDRVAHLGEDLRKVAHEKMIEIQHEYETLTQRST